MILSQILLIAHVFSLSHVIIHRPTVLFTKANSFFAFCLSLTLVHGLIRLLHIYPQPHILHTWFSDKLCSRKWNSDIAACRINHLRQTSFAALYYFVFCSTTQQQLLHNDIQDYTVLSSSANVSLSYYSTAFTFLSRVDYVNGVSCSK